MAAVDAQRVVAVGRKRIVQRRNFFDGAHDGPGDEMRVGKFALTVGGAVRVDGAAVLVEHFDGQYAQAGGGGNGEARRHVLGDFQRGATQRQRLIVLAQRHCGTAGGGSGQRSHLGSSIEFGLDGSGGAVRRQAVGIEALAVGVEHLLPAGVHSLAVVEVLMIQLVFEPTVYTWSGGIRHRGFYLT